MEKDFLCMLEKVNQLALTDEEREQVLAFLTKQEEDFSALNDIPTEDVERMVYVMPMNTVVREDKEVKLFTREQLQAQAPESMDGYWQVPRLVE